MKFSTHTDVKGKYVYGKIEGNKFRMINLSVLSVSPPLSKVIEFNEGQLEALIHELELIKNRMVSDTTKPFCESEDTQ